MGPPPILYSGTKILRARFLPQKSSKRPFWALFLDNHLPKMPYVQHEHWKGKKIDRTPPAPGGEGGLSPLTHTPSYIEPWTYHAMQHQCHAMPCHATSPCHVHASSTNCHDWHGPSVVPIAALNSCGRVSKDRTPWVPDLTFQLRPWKVDNNFFIR